MIATPYIIHIQTNAGILRNHLHSKAFRSIDNDFFVRAKRTWLHINWSDILLLSVQNRDKEWTVWKKKRRRMKDKNFLCTMKLLSSLPSQLGARESSHFHVHSDCTFKSMARLVGHMTRHKVVISRVWKRCHRMKACTHLPLSRISCSTKLIDQIIAA